MNRISQTVPLQFDTVFSPFKAAEFDIALESIAKAGFSGVELAIAHPKDVDIKSLTQRLRNNKLDVTTISTGQAYALNGVFLSSFDKETRDAAASLINGHVDLSAQLGFPPVTIGLLRGKLEKGEKQALLQNLSLAIEPCIKYAQKLGVILQLEPICKEETSLINTVYDALGFIEMLGNPENMGILYDTYHSYREDGDMYTAILAAGTRVTNVHLSDSHRGLPGYGDIDFDTVAKALQKIGYRGAYALETLVIPDRDFIIKHGYDSATVVK
ncbi:MAG: sugar phosphate isomerase/epimerase [Defluviitaleaceae bacterium]|nr:sugar phosphate isomerase/epimerase [Defluviitaleaceae bacterium]